MTYLVGRGIADITGEPSGAGMMGYGRADQRTEGIHMRQRSRAFVIVDADSDRRVVIVVADIAMFFNSVHQAVLRRLAESYGETYTAENVMLTATHTHAIPGGYSHHLLYNLTTGGFRRRTFDALVNGVVESIDRAHDDVRPATLALSRTWLYDASVNRSRVAFDRNPEFDRSHFPHGIDPLSTLLRMERDGHLVGALNWFALHNTSMTGNNRLISGDNKGYAGYYWETLTAGAGYLPGEELPLIAGFAQTNAGDVSPNLGLKPGHGPTDDEVENTRIIGMRQYEAAAGQLAAPGEQLSGTVDHRLMYVDLSAVTITPEFTGDEQVHRTGPAMIGAAMAAGSHEDGPGLPRFREGFDPRFARLSRRGYARNPDLAAVQAPKQILVPVGLMNRPWPFVQQVLPIQVIRIGTLYLIGVPAEMTVVAGFRLRRTVAKIMSTDLDHVLIAGYANAYAHYVTTHEEYDAQQYEGGSTLFGRWTCAALQQVVAELATAMRAGKHVDLGAPPADLSRAPVFRPARRPDLAPPGRQFGDVLLGPLATYRPRDQAYVVFVSADPDNDLRRGDTYLRVERRRGRRWVTVADDGDWSTTIRWRRDRRTGWTAHITWDLPGTAEPGEYRISHYGTARDARNSLTPFTGTTRTFTI